MVERFARVRYRAIIVLLTCTLGLLYVGYQSVQGERGLLGWVERSAEVEKSRAEVAALAEERAKLERRVSQLRSESLDLDLLDQEARRLLNLGHPDEEVLFHDRPARPPAPEGGE
ncbi:MAG: septum formation initiator family protein [Rhodospirillales bacterium]|nr:septum formation initiator family protein [Rhodospirillales bacterium]